MAVNGSFATSQYQQGSRHGPYQSPSAPRASVPQIPGKDDLEKLENLKRIIKSGQHEFYRAIPQPDALAKLYMGVIPSSLPQDGEQGQATFAANPDQNPVTSQPGGASNSSPTSPVDSSRRHPRYQNKDSSNVSPRKLSATNGSSQHGAMHNGYGSNGSPTIRPEQGLDVASSNGLIATAQQGSSAADPDAMDVTANHQEAGSGGASGMTGTTKPPGLPVKPDVPQPSIERVRADSAAGRLPASLPEKPSADVRAGPGRPAPPPNGWQGRNDPGRSELYDRPPPSTPAGPSHSQDNRLQERESRDFQNRNRSWSERKPNDRYPRNAERPLDPSLPPRSGPPVKTEEIPISLSDSEPRPASGPADSRLGFVHDRNAHEFPRSNEPMTATEPLPQSVPGLSSEPNGQARSFPSAAPLRRESYPPQESKPDSDVAPKEPHSSPHTNGVGSSDGPTHARESYPPRAPSPSGKQHTRDDVRGVPSKAGPSPAPNQNQPRHNGPRPYRPPPNNYRPDYGDTARRTDRMDVDEPRYADRSYRPYSPPPDPSRDRGRAIPPSPGRGAPEYDDPRRYSNAPPPGNYAAPPPSTYGGQPQRWEDDPYYKSRASHWDPSLERDRYEREPARGTWDARADRDPRGYARGPPGAPPIDDRYPAYREPDRAARPPPNTAVPPYSRTRPRSPSPVRRGGAPMMVDDPRPPLKRPRDDYGPPPPHHAPAAPSGDYYSPRNPDMTRSRPPPGSDYNNPPPGPPPSSGGSSSFYDRSGPPPPSSSTMSSDRDRDYMRRDVGIDYASPLPPPQHAGYGRPRSPPPGARLGSSSAPYDNRAPYSRGPPPPPPSNGRDSRPYGMPPPRP